MTHAPDNTTAKAAHPFETPVAEGVFKSLLWVVLILQVLVFARMYHKLVAALPDRSTQANQHVNVR